MRRSAAKSKKTGHSCSRCEPPQCRPEEPVSIDVTDPRFAEPEYWMPDVELRAELEELYPGDPGQRSGAMLLFNDSGECACLSVEMGIHCLGLLSDWPLREFLRRVLGRMQRDDEDGMELTAKLGELYPSCIPWRPSGGVLRCSGVGQNTELGVYFGTHCFGIAREPVLWEFLRRAVVRSMVGLSETETDLPLEFTDSDQKFLRAAGISGAAGGA